MIRIALVTVLAGSTLGAAACAPATAPPSKPTAAGSTASADPCRGADFDFDAPPAACMVPHRELASPPKGALSIRTVPSPAHVRSGRSAQITLEMRNVSGAPLSLDVDDSCLAFTAQADSAKAHSFDSECGGLCASAPTMMHVTLEPNGVVRKRVPFEAVMRTIKGDQCTERVLGPLPPGAYTLEVFLPWTDPTPIPGNAQARSSREFEGPLVVDAP